MNSETMNSGETMNCDSSAMTSGWIDLSHSESIYAFAADQHADKQDYDLAIRRKFMRGLMKRNADDRAFRVNDGELLYEMVREPQISEEVANLYECEARQNAKFNYVGKHKGKVMPKAKQLSDVYFEEQQMSDTYNYGRGF